jgi:hypothetical protein
LHQRAKQAKAAGDVAKASRIRRDNLGRKTRRKQRAQGEAAVKTLAGRAVRAALKTQPAVVAALNLISRLDDPEIRPWTPTGRVRAILDGRLRRRKEPRKSAATGGLPTGIPLPTGL